MTTTWTIKIWKIGAAEPEVIDATGWAQNEEILTVLTSDGEQPHDRVVINTKYVARVSITRATKTVLN